MELVGKFCPSSPGHHGFVGSGSHQRALIINSRGSSGQVCNSIRKASTALERSQKSIRQVFRKWESSTHKSVNQQEINARIRVSCKVGDSPTDSPRKKGKIPSRDSLIKNEKSVDERQNLQKAGATTGSKSSESLTLNNVATNGATTYLFHVDGGGQVRAFVGKASSAKYFVDLEVDVPEIEGAVCLHWGLFRSDSTDWVLLDPNAVPQGTKYINGKAQAMQTTLQAGPAGLRTLKLEFDSENTPLYVQFVLFQPASGNERELWMRNSRGGNFCIPVGIGRGLPEPLGPTWKKNGSTNFALYSKNAKNVILCLYTDDAIEPSMEIDLDQSIHRTGDIWHIELQDVGSYSRYGYRCKGEASWESGNRYHARHVLLDPYAKLLAPSVPGQETVPSIATVLGWLKRESVPFNWEDDISLRTPSERLVLYKLNVAGFTADESSSPDEGIRGTFDGVITKIQHLVKLGVNAIIVEPIFAHWDNHMHPISFFCPDAMYGPGDSLSACTALKRMVKELHKNGIEIILEVVFSNTAEGGDESPNTISFRGIDNSTFYILNEYGRVVKSKFGTENAFNCNHPFVQTMILDSLRYWVEEFHVDGFLFVNGSSLVTGAHGQELSRPPLVEAISFDPILASTKFIVDCNSRLPGVSKIQSFPHWAIWSELNNSFRDNVRQFLRGDPGHLSTFATRLCGSADIFGDGRGPCHSMNFVTSSTGFTLADLVSYSASDGVSTEFSWNCGEEGPSENPFVLETRVKQVRNFIVALFLSEGVPVLSMGDEYGHSTGGVLSSETKPIQFLWSYVDTEFCEQMTALISSLIAFRSRRKDLYERTAYGKPDVITWHGADSRQPQWEQPESSFLGAHFHAEDQKDIGRPQTGDLYIAFNAHQTAVTATLPEPPIGMAWSRIADTSLPHPDEFQLEGVPVNMTGDKRSTSLYELQPNSSVVLEARERFIVSRRNSGLKFPAIRTSK